MATVVIENPEQYAAFILAEKLGCSIEDARKVKAGKLKPENAVKKTVKKKEDKE